MPAQAASKKTKDPITLNKTQFSIKQGGEEKLTATVNPSNATDKTIHWASSNQAVARVSGNGTVRAVVDDGIFSKDNAMISSYITDKVMRPNPSSSSNITSFTDVPLLTLGNGTQSQRLEGNPSESGRGC